jgi:hypothetical protein
MSETDVLIYQIGIAVVIAIVGVYLYYWQKDRRKGSGKTTEKPTQTAPLLKIQAYERLVIFVERCGFGSLLERLPAGTLDAKQLAQVYIEAIRSEFEYNLSQQIYVSPAIWQAICDAKNQQTFIIMELLKSLPADAPAQLLEKSIQILLETNQQASIQPLVLDALKKEATHYLTQI